MKYRVNENEFATFTQARKYAESIGSEVYQIDNGMRRWTPAAKPSAKRTRQYNEQAAAYEAQQRAAVK